MFEYLASAKNVIDSNVIGAAGLYGTLASVLAGFAFTALVLLVTTWVADKRPEVPMADKRFGGPKAAKRSGNSTVDDSVVPTAEKVLAATGRALVGSFLGLIIMAMSYTALSSNQDNSYLALSENTILADGFAGVGVALVYTIVAMLDAAVQDAGTTSRLWTVVRFARISACVLNLLIMGMVYNAASLYENVKYYSKSYSVSTIDVVSWLMLAVELVVALGAAWLITRPSPSPWAGELALARAESTAAWAGLALPVLAGIGYLIADATLQDSSLIPAFWAYLILAVAFALTMGATVQMALTSPGMPPIREPEPPKHGTQTWGKRLRNWIDI